MPAVPLRVTLHHNSSIDAAGLLPYTWTRHTCRISIRPKYYFHGVRCTGNASGRQSSSTNTGWSKPNSAELSILFSVLAAVFHQIPGPDTCAAYQYVAYVIVMLYAQLQRIKIEPCVPTRAKLVTTWTRRREVVCTGLQHESCQYICARICAAYQNVALIIVKL